MVSAVPSVPPTRRSPALLLAAILASLSLLSAACSEAAGRGGSSGGASGEQAAANSSDAPPDQGPDPLPDPGVAPGECKQVTYTPPSAAQAFQGELCRPEKDQRDVAVMVVHGGSGVSGGPTGMRPWASRLLAEGYVVLMPAYHLFTPGGERPVFPRPEQNIKAAVQYLRGIANATGIRRERIVVQGMSAGARLGSVAYTHPDEPYFQGPELWPDISDEVNGFIGFYHTYDGSMQYSTQYYGGPDDSKDPQVRDRWDHADAMASASAARGPALFITGDRDWNLIIEHQNEFAERLRSAGQQATTVVIKGGSHGFDSSGGKRLSRLGEQAASEVLRWLNDRFPQRPPRPAEASSIDLASAPNYTGGPPPTFEQRRRLTRPTTTTTASAGGTTTVPSTTTSSSTIPPPPTTVTTIEATTTTTLEPPTTVTTAPAIETGSGG